jgi:oligoendopeptidase F
MGRTTWSACATPYAAIKGILDMASAYPFEPLDWKTLTPLYTALIEAPVAPGQFMTWLEQWNQLDIAVWDAYTALKRPAYYDTRDQAAEQAYSRYVQELYSTYLGLTNQLITRALMLQPEAPAPVYEQLWRRWRNQQMLFHSDNLPIQAEISGLESHYREIMNRVDVENPTGYWLDRRGELNELLLRLLGLRRTLARTSGLPTFLAYRWRELNRLDYTIADCQAFHRAIETIVVPAVMGLPFAQAARPPMPEISDLTRLKAGVESILHQVDPTFGAVFRAMRDDYLDVGSRPGKANAVEEWFFPGVGLPYLHVVTTNVGSMLHESGHALHDYLSFQAHRSMWNLNGPEEFQEFVATSLDLLSWPYYAQEQGGLFTAEETIQARQHVLHYYLDALVDCTLQDAFEHWVYGEAPADVTASELDAKWLEVNRRFKPWVEEAANPAEAKTGWQRWQWSLFRMPLYMITYPMAIVGACQFGRVVERDRKRAIHNYKTALAHGNTQTLPELFRTVGLAFPFTPEVVEEAVQFVVAQSQALVS